MMVHIFTIAYLVAAGAHISAMSLENFVRRAVPFDPSTISSQCQSICTPIINTINNCTSEACACTSTNGNGLQTCADCLVEVDPTNAMKTYWQTALTQFSDVCSAASLSITPLTISITFSGTSTGAASSTPLSVSISTTTSTTTATSVALVTTSTSPGSVAASSSSSMGSTTARTSSSSAPTSSNACQRNLVRMTEMAVGFAAMFMSAVVFIY